MSKTHHSSHEDTPPTDVPWNWDKIHISLLYDIRKELKALNSHLRCRNFVDIPTILRRIDRNTKKRKPKKKVAP